MLWSSTSIISLSKWDGVLWMAVCTERSNTDKASLTKIKMILSWGSSDEYHMFLHLKDKTEEWHESTPPHSGIYDKSLSDWPVRAEIRDWPGDGETVTEVAVVTIIAELSAGNPSTFWAQVMTPVIKQWGAGVGGWWRWSIFIFLCGVIWRVEGGGRKSMHFVPNTRFIKHSSSGPYHECLIADYGEVAW